MTPEQLEAHRVRFEQQSGEPETMKGQRRGDGYANHSDTRTWQAYQCGIADADRAQRAAPGVQGGEPTPWRNEMMDMAIAAGVAPNTIFHFEAAFLRFAESLEKKINTAQPPQQSAQPVVVITVQRNALVSASRLVGFDALPDGDHSLYAAAQPVEVQRVPLTADEVWSNNDLMALNAELGLTLDQFIELVRAIESANGIKPTSSEGGT